MAISKVTANGLADDSVDTAQIADDAVESAQLANNVAMTIDSSENVGLGTTTPATSLEISGTTANTQGGAFPRIQITTTSDSNPTYSGSLDIVEKQSSATSSAVFGTAHVYGFRTMLDGFNNVLKWFSGSQVTVTERMGLDRDTGNLTLNTGNLVIGTAGKGIDFSANAHATDMDSELLDDYEEGECSLTMGGSSNIGTSAANIQANNNYSGGQAFYVKIGCLCYIQAYFFSQSTTTQAAGELQIHGLPFTAHANGGSINTQSYNLNLQATGDQVGIPMTSGGTQLNYILNRDSQTWTSVNANVMPNNTAIYVRIAGTYKTV